MKLPSIQLPKWPALVVEGKSVSTDLAAEILIRTDAHLPYFTYVGNDQDVVRELSEIFGIPERDVNWEAIDQLYKKLKKIPLGYLHNAQILSSWIGGPHGWINWHGQVGCNTFNIGKWPTVEAVYEDWVAIARAFKTLELRAWLYNKEIEEEDGKPVVFFEVAGGRVRVSPADPVSPRIPCGTLSLDLTNVAKLFSMPARMRELGIDPRVLKQHLISVYGKIPQYRAPKTVHD